MSRYTRVTEAVIDKLQRDYRAGRGLGQSLPHLDEVEAATIVAESLEADRLLNTPLDELTQHSVEPESDWALAVFAEMLFAIADHLRSEDVPQQKWNRFESLAWHALERALESPTASPLLWYEDIYLSVAQEYRLKGDRRAVELLKRGLAHDLRYYDGNNAKTFMLHLAECHLWLGELNRGLEMYAALLQNDPTDVYVYNSISLVFNQVGLSDPGEKATERALELVEATDDPEGLGDQLASHLEDMRRSEKRGRAAEIDSQVLAEFRAALAVDFDAGRNLPVEDLARKIIPGLDQVPVKETPDMPDLPPPVALNGRRESQKVDRDLGRNDPCWCGSGKKYKHCHMHSDQQWGID